MSRQSCRRCRLAADRAELLVGSPGSGSHVVIGFDLEFVVPVGNEVGPQIVVIDGAQSHVGVHNEHGVGVGIFQDEIMSLASRGRIPGKLRAQGLQASCGLQVSGSLGGGIAIHGDTSGIGEA